MKPLVVANWKMNPPTLAKANLLFNTIVKKVKHLKNAEVVICPPFIYLPYFLNSKFPFSNLKIGAQDCFWEEKGAFTGEVSAAMLKDLGCQYVILGHSERRKYFGETDEMINKKIKAAIVAKLKPILCIGETKEEKEVGKTFEVLQSQLKKALFFIPNSKFLIVAYEPVWAIGTGKACGIFRAKKMNLFIRKIVKNIPILYGGSVNSENAKDYIEKADFDGLLVGKVSLDAEEFGKIVKSIDLISQK